MIKRKMRKMVIQFFFSIKCSLRSLSLWHFHSCTTRVFSYLIFHKKNTNSYRTVPATAVTFSLFCILYINYTRSWLNLRAQCFLVNLGGCVENFTISKRTVFFLVIDIETEFKVSVCSRCSHVKNVFH